MAGHGLVVLVSFFKGATEEVLPKAVKAILNLPLLAGPKGRGASLAALAAGKFAGAEVILLCDWRCCCVGGGVQ